MANSPKDLISPVTFEQVVGLSPDRFPGEIVDGEWVPERPLHPMHSIVQNRLVERIYNVRRLNPDRSVAIGNPGVKLARQPDTLLGPEIAITAKSRVPTGHGVNAWLEGAPDFCVEIRRVGQSNGDIDARARRYLMSGGELVWMVDPALEAVHVYSKGRVQPEIAAGRDTLNTNGVFAGLSIKVSELFE